MSFKSFSKTIVDKPSNTLTKLFVLAFLSGVIVLLLPWTQNIKSTGTVSSIRPNQRPQQVNSIIAGRIEKWYIRDGQKVEKGDTLLKISEVKEEYLDNSLLERTRDQLNAKIDAIEFYGQKADMATQQELALNESMALKLEQTQNKLKQYTLQLESDSMNYVAANNQFNISTEQLNRQKQLYAAGLKSLTELEQKQQYLQDALNKKISAENKFLNGKNELLNIKLELLAVEQQYYEKIAKTDGERFSALSQVSTTKGEVAKLKNQYANYKKRQTFYIITAPQAGQVIQSVKSGIGETVKEGENLMQIVPEKYDAAVEMFVTPLNMPLLNLGQRVQIQFDGFPAIIFSGWPDASYGIFEGEIMAIDRSILPNGNFRVWVKPEEEKAWPDNLRFGTGAKTITLLNDVPLFYELWRQINGFPPEFYTPKTATTKEKNEN
ncbi:MAG TPA: biotin/lipoyl-binding protein [Pelobium sp.]|nr:biotin/lipoyl-binding protein [Pelobium sp.]